MDGRKPKKILAVDDHPLIREALARLVAELELGTAVLEADTVGAAQDCLALHPDIALTVLDVALPDSAGIQGLVRLLKSRPNVPVLVFSAEDDPGSARAVIDAGAIGFVSKRSPTRVLTEALRVVLLGGPHVPPRALHANRRRNREPDKGGGSTPDALTFAPLKLPRQVERARRARSGDAEVDRPNLQSCPRDGRNARRGDLSGARSDKPHASSVRGQPPRRRPSRRRRRLLARDSGGSIDTRFAAAALKRRNPPPPAPRTARPARSPP